MNATGKNGMFAQFHTYTIDILVENSPKARPKPAAVGLPRRSRCA